MAIKKQRKKRSVKSIGSRPINCDACHSDLPHYMDGTWSGPVASDDKTGRGAGLIWSKIMGHPCCSYRTTWASCGNSLTVST